MGREVAIKVSAERFSDRFEREVHAVAALNHANICHVYDVGPNYLVMELVDGPTLAERIATGTTIPSVHHQGLRETTRREGTIRMKTSIADSIRAHVFTRYIEPARRRGDRTVSFTAGSIQTELQMHNRLPSVCSAIGSLRFQNQFGVKVRPVSIPLNSSTTTFVVEV
jgi:hypothetical protein